jgi:taurine dioxygenase
MTLNIEVIKPTIGAIIHDVDLNTADENTTQQIQQALLDHHVIFFRNQQLAPQAQAELARFWFFAYSSDLSISRKCA